MTQEKNISANNGYLMLFTSLFLLFGGIYLLFSYENAWFTILIFTAIFIFPGFILVNPNGSRVLLLFGKYVGTIKQNGFLGKPFLYKEKNFTSS